MDLAEGWQQRTKQKLALAGCVAVALSVRTSPLTTGSRLKGLVHKLVGYSGAAILFSGVQETCRAVRGRHDFLNSAVSGALTGAVVVGHYQGSKYRLLGLVSWGSACGLLHLVNAALQPRYLLEDYLIREGLLSPEVAHLREGSSSDTREVGLLAPQLEHRDVLLESMAIRDREMRQLNDRLVAAAANRSVAPPSAVSQPRVTYGNLDVSDIADDDEGYMAWLRTSGLEADLLLQPRQAAVDSGSSSGGGGGSGGVEDSAKDFTATAGRADATHAEGAGDGQTTAVTAGKGRSWIGWWSGWKWGRRSDKSTGAARSGREARSDSSE